MGAEIAVPLKLRCVWRRHLYLSADTRMLAPPSFSITAINRCIDKLMLTGGQRGDYLKLETCNSQWRSCIAVTAGFSFTVGWEPFRFEERSLGKAVCLEKKNKPYQFPAD